MKKNRNQKQKDKMKRHAGKRDERHCRSRHRQTKVSEFVKLIFATLKVAINLEKTGAECWARIFLWLRE